LPKETKIIYILEIQTRAQDKNEKYSKYNWYEKQQKYPQGPPDNGIRPQHNKIHAID
jgi:hypothetical protein